MQTAQPSAAPTMQPTTFVSATMPSVAQYAPARTSTGLLNRAFDPKSPLSEGIQRTPWPAKYKPIQLPKFSGRSDPHLFIMSYEAAIASAGRDETVLAKSFIIAAEGDALAWYTMLKPSTIYSWVNLRDKILANFKGYTSESLTSMDLFLCKQNQGEPLKDYFQRFLQIKSKAPS